MRGVGWHGVVSSGVDVGAGFGKAVKVGGV